MAPKRELFVAVGDGGAPPPEEKRQRAAAGPGRSSSHEPPPPTPSPKHFLTIVFVVLFLKRQKGRNTDSVAISPSLISRMLTELGHVRQSLNTIIREQKIMKQWIQALSQKVDTMTQSSAKHHNHNRPIRQDTNQEQEGTISEPQGLTTAEGKGENTSNIQLRFLGGMKTPVYHDDEIKSASNTAIKIGIFNGDKMIESGRISNVQVEIFALDGDFPHASPKSWTAKKFNKHRANSRDGNGNVLAGEGTKVKLKNGQCDLGSIKFTEGSCKARGGKFIIGARICEGEVSGLRVQEAVMNPVAVQDRRNKANVKNHPPKLNDSVRRLEEIAKVYAERLEEEKIFTVEDFLKALNKDPYNLAKILKVNMEHKSWKRMTEHARECKPSLEGRHKLKLFICTEKNVKLFFNCVHYLVGAEFSGGPYTPSEKFKPAQQELVGQLKECAYAKLDALPEDYVMTDNSPSPIHVDEYTSNGASSSCMPSEQPNCSVPLASVQVTEKAEGLSHSPIESSCAYANNNPIPSSFIPDHCRMHRYQGGGIPVPPVEGLSHAHNNVFAEEINNNPGPSSSNSDHLYPYNYRDSADQGNQLANQEQSLCQNALVGTSNMCQFVSHDEDVELEFLQQQVDTHNYVAPGLDGIEILSQLFWPESGNGTLDASTSAHINITSPPQQLQYAGTPRSAQGSTQSQMPAPLAPSNDASVVSASVQQALPPQQWYPGDNSW